MQYGVEFFVAPDKRIAISETAMVTSAEMAGVFFPQASNAVSEASIPSSIPRFCAEVCGCLALHYNKPVIDLRLLRRRPAN